MGYDSPLAKDISLFCDIYLETLQLQERDEDAIVITEDVENEDDATAMARKDLEKNLSRETVDSGLAKRLSELDS